MNILLRKLARSYTWGLDGSYHSSFGNISDLANHIEHPLSFSPGQNRQLLILWILLLDFFSLVYSTHQILLKEKWFSY